MHRCTLQKRLWLFRVYVAIPTMVSPFAGLNYWTELLDWIELPSFFGQVSVFIFRKKPRLLQVAIMNYCNDNLLFTIQQIIHL